MQTVKKYYDLAKPGIVYGNMLAAVGAFLFASRSDFLGTLVTLLSLCVGFSLILGGACVLNNILDRRYDALMSRTKKRALPQHTISVVHAVLFGVVLVAIGSVVLALGTNLLTLTMALFCLFAYVVLYTLSKPHTVHSTLIGTISGATPPVVGYAAEVGVLDINALLLFLILVCWQMPHFYAIGIFRHDDYKKAGLPIVPVVYGIEEARRRITRFAVAFFVAVNLFWLLGSASWLFGLVMTPMAAYWVYLCMQNGKDTPKWAKKQFLFSLSVLLVLSAMLAIDGQIANRLLNL